MLKRLHRKPAFRRRGFTLLEVLIVLAIIGVIAAMVVPRLLGSQRQANIDATKIVLKSAQSAIELYASKENAGYLPKASGNEDIWALLMNPPQRDGRPVEPYASEPFKDAWGRKLYYEWNGSDATSTTPKIWSAGPDGENQSGSGDDINNWTTVDKG